MPASTATLLQHQTILNYLLKNGSWTPPGTLYVALFTVLPNISTYGGTEVSGSGTSYARVAITKDTGWTGPTGSPATEYNNTSDLTFPTPTGNWGTIVGAGLFNTDNLATAFSSSLLYVAQLVSPKAVNNGDGAPRILAGQLKITRAT